MIFSNGFCEMIQDMATHRKSAGAVFHHGWTLKMQSMTKGSSKSLDAMLKLAELLAHDRAETDIQLLEDVALIWHTGNSWTDLVKRFLNTTAGIPTDLLAGSESAQHWAQGKTWLVTHNILTPTLGSGVGVNLQASVADDDHMSYLSYALKNKAGTLSLPAALPAKFSVTIGAGEDQSAPADICAVRSLPGLTYNGTYPSSTTSNVGSTNDDLNANLEDDAGKLPISEIASASSAAAAWIAMTPGLKKIPDMIGSNLTPWVCTADGGQAFSEASRLVAAIPTPVTDQALQAVARNSVRGLADAGLTEGTGVGQAVAEGATDIVAFMNLSSSSGEYDDPSFLLKLFAGDTHGVCGFPVFQSPSREALAAAYSGSDTAGMASFKALPGKSHLKGIKVGTIHCVTADNMWLGISAGTPVCLHVIAVGADLGIIGVQAIEETSTFESNHYDAFVQEIVDCITDTDPATRDIVTSALLPMFIS
jgi:hypothetical protein